MQIEEFTLKLTSPAFMGNAEQKGQWRTPPIKALLRQWWRVAYAAQHGFKISVPDMRQKEGRLFGFAADIGLKNGQGDSLQAQQSLLRLRLMEAKGKNPWTLGSQQGVAPLSDKLDTSYAWFGLIKRGNNGPDKTAIKPDDIEGRRLLKLALPEQHWPQIQQSLQLINQFATLGSRSRGGWGSLQLEGVEPLTAAQLNKYARPLDQCLADDWAMSLAVDSHGLLCWQSNKAYKDWAAAMSFIALQRKLVRGELKLPQNRREAVGFANSNGRMPSPLRWKVVPKAAGVQVIAFALPHQIPSDSRVRMPPQLLSSAWQTVAQTLDASDFSRLK